MLYFIDELHLELNSLESKNIDIDVMVEISQQRKQRKHIVGTSQVYMRLAKPIREQIFNIVSCRGFFKAIQWNTLIDGEQSYEENGKLHAKVIGHYCWLHSPEMYDRYDTYAKMKRYRNEWQGHKRDTPYYQQALLLKGDESKMTFTDPIVEVIAMFLGRALSYAVLIAVITRVGNMVVRAFSGKENFF